MTGGNLGPVVKRARHRPFKAVAQGSNPAGIIVAYFGIWRNRIAHRVPDPAVPGSNPGMSIQNMSVILSPLCQA